MEMRIFQMPLVRSKHEKGFNSSSSLQVPKVVFVGYKMEISSFLSVAMAATSTSNPPGPSFSTSGLKTFYYFFFFNTVLACIVYLCLFCRKTYRLPEKVRVCWLRNGNFFFRSAHAYSHQQKLSLRAGLSTWGLETKSLAKHKKAYPMCVYYTHKKMLRAWSCLRWWLSLESSTIPLVRTFIHESWYFQALCFLFLS